MKEKRYQQIARLIFEYKKALSQETESDAQEAQEKLGKIEECLPSGSVVLSGPQIGSGIHKGPFFNVDLSTEERIIICLEYKHQEYLDSEQTTTTRTITTHAELTSHTITVRPSLLKGILLQISGQNRNGVKKYLYEAFYTCLMEDV